MIENRFQNSQDPAGDIVWENAEHRLVLSPAKGGKVISWRRSGQELVRQLDVTNGGLMRVLLGEESYPGASHETQHLVRAHEQDSNGFSTDLRFYWNTSNAIARALGWDAKTNPCYLDHLLLDKCLTFDAISGTLLVEIAISNRGDARRRISPWLHNHFAGRVPRGHVLFDGEAELFTWADLHWAGHRARPDRQMRLVHAIDDSQIQLVLGGTGLDGVASYACPEFGIDSNEHCMELRYSPINLEPGQCWRANAFVAATRDPAAWAVTSPKPLYARIEPARDDWEESSLLALLPRWALEEERKRGFMVLSHLDKVPFTSVHRYAAANCFSSFHESQQSAAADISLVALGDLARLDAVVDGENWHIDNSPASLRVGEVARLVLRGPRSLEGKQQVCVRLTADGGEVALRVTPDAQVEPMYPYQVKQTSTYLDERWHAERDGFKGGTREELYAWQRRGRVRMMRWIRGAIIDESPLAPRLMERQIGPFCVRDKILLQTEPDMWLPTYVVYPREKPGAPMPALLFAHGSCAGKLMFTPDETADMQDEKTFDEWPWPYQFAHQLKCLVLLPDRRGWGEWSESNHGSQHQRAEIAGYDIPAMDIWDHMRAVDYLLERPDVDSSRVISMGSSGGGWLTLFLSGLHDKLAGGIVSSSVNYLPNLPEQYFYQMSLEPAEALIPRRPWPLAPGTVMCLAAPQPLWIMDGLWDRGVLHSHNEPEEAAARQFAAWHVAANAARREIGRMYEIAGASDNYRATWFEGGHLAGFTFREIAPWLHEKFGIERTARGSS